MLVHGFRIQRLRVLGSRRLGSHSQRLFIYLFVFFFWGGQFRLFGFVRGLIGFYGSRLHGGQRRISSGRLTTGCKFFDLGLPHLYLVSIPEPYCANRLPSPVIGEVGSTLLFNLGA